MLGPDNTSDSQVVTDDFTLTWSASPGATLYDVYASLTDSSYTLWDGDVAATSLFVSFAAAVGNANWWYVIAHDGLGNFSAPSNHLECTPNLPPSSTYRRPGGVDTYRRPGGTDSYLRP